VTKSQREKHVAQNTVNQQLGRQTCRRLIISYRIYYGGAAQHKTNINNYSAVRIIAMRFISGHTCA